MSTLLLSPEALAGDEASISGEAYRHHFRAARLAVGDAVRAVDGEGRARHGTVVRVDRRAGLIALGEEAASREPDRHLELFVAAPRPQRASWLVEKATEVGVQAVRFLATARGVRGLGGGQIGRLERVARAAVEQCGRARLPALTGPHPVAALPALLAALPARFALDLEAGSHPADLPPGVGAGPLALLVGPEGGWTDGERMALAALGARRLSVGSRVLRVETAAVVGAALLLLGQPPPAGEGPLR